MSLCHIWFGVERSNRRSGAFGFLRAFAFGSTRAALFRCLLTCVGLAFRKKNRRRICDSRFGPCAGFSRFSAMIFSLTGSGSLDFPALQGLSLSPSSPCR